ncbi:PIN domain-containing protein [Geomonas anaerohicana]|uniref:DUF4935 domain-containing protein n=1 Tax=Geomonas anaerohicana TaxID=2798583 RepID=A0ABS0YGF3_9BACT|nr:PIN domain-containing protein [Geomonas anaerohicana]MBJ6750977.1 DUF4935 domain-containing protein [Geomonas anaerohicana]
MKVFLDTNIFYNDWFMKNANFRYLFHFLNNEGHSLLISKLVIEEAENIRNRELSESLLDIKKSINRINKLNYNDVYFAQESLGVEKFELLPMIRSRTENIEEIEYEGIPHSVVVGRALINKKPFIEGEKGYRDTLIWLSFMDYLAKNDIEEDVVFITQNKSDFFKVKDKVLHFHQDLCSDIEHKTLKAKITPYASLFDFVNSAIDKDVHAIDHYASEKLFEQFIFEESSKFITEMSNVDLSKHFGYTIFETNVKTILSTRVEIYEGLEDIDILQTQRLEGDDVYVSYSYNLRGVTVEIDIPEIDYFMNKIEILKVADDVDVISEVVTLHFFMRPYFDVSFIYNARLDTLKNFEVARIWLR